MDTQNDSRARHEVRAVEAMQADGTAGTSPILVTGGTGALGGLVVRRLRDAGYAVRVLSRQHRTSEEEGIAFVTGDLAKGEGIEPTVAGVAIIVHCAGNATGNEQQTRNLVQGDARWSAHYGLQECPLGRRSKAG